jgi:tetratricopeptide (TPR) repeat protein
MRREKMLQDQQKMQKSAAESLKRMRENQQQSALRLRDAARLQAEQRKRGRQLQEKVQDESASNVLTQIQPPSFKEPTMAQTNQQNPDLYEQGKQHYYQRQFGKAEDAFTQLSKDKANRPAACYGLGVLYYAQGKLEPAETNLKKCIAGGADANLSADALYYLGQIALRRRDISGAAALHRQALEKNADHFGADSQLDRLERYTLDYAKALYRVRRFNQSKKAFESMLSSKKYKAAGYYGLGVIAFHQSDPALATTMLNKAIDIHPAHANAWYYLGRIAEEKGEQKSKIESIYKKALEINASHVGALAQINRLKISSQRGVARSGTKPKKKVVRTSPKLPIKRRAKR